MVFLVLLLAWFLMYAYSSACSWDRTQCVKQSVVLEPEKFYDLIYGHCGDIWNQTKPQRYKSVIGNKSLLINTAWETDEVVLSVAAGFLTMGPPNQIILLNGSPNYDTWNRDFLEEFLKSLEIDNIFQLTEPSLVENAVFFDVSSLLRCSCCHDLMASNQLFRGKIFRANNPGNLLWQNPVHFCPNLRESLLLLSNQDRTASDPPVVHYVNMLNEAFPQASFSAVRKTVWINSRVWGGDPVRVAGLVAVHEFIPMPLFSKISSSTIVVLIRSRKELTADIVIARALGYSVCLLILRGNKLVPEKDCDEAFRLRTQLCFDPVGQHSARLLDRATTKGVEDNSSVLTRLPKCGVNCQVHLAPCNGSVLHNGICLPPVWPPHYDSTRFFKGSWLARVSPPYLQDKPPLRIPVHLHRQVFVDGFLIDKTLSSDYDLYEHSVELVGELEVPKPSFRLVGSAPVYDGSGAVYIYFYLSSSANDLWRCKFGDPTADVLKTSQKIIVESAPKKPIPSYAVIFHHGLRKYLLLCSASSGKGLSTVLRFCSQDGIHFSRCSSNRTSESDEELGGIHDTFTAYSDPLRDKDVVHLRTDLMASRTCFQAESDGLWNERGQILMPWKGRASAVLSFCDLMPSDESMPFDQYWDDETYTRYVPVLYHVQHRQVDTYSVFSTQFESVTATVRMEHVAGHTYDKYIVPFIHFSRDGFHHGKGLSPLHNTIHGHQVPNWWGYSFCQLFPRPLQDDLYLMCETTVPSSRVILYKIRREGFVSLTPSNENRLDVWTEWLFMPKLSGLLVNLQMFQYAEFHACLYPQGEEKPFCFEPLEGPLNSTKVSLDWPSNRPVFQSPTTFRLRFRMFGRAHLYSFWFPETVFIGGSESF